MELGTLVLLMPSSPPETLPPRRSSHRSVNPKTASKSPTHVRIPIKNHTETPKSTMNDKMSKRDSFSRVSPEQSEPKRRKRVGEEKSRHVKFDKIKEKKRNGDTAKNLKVYYKKIVHDGGEFAAGDDVYVKRREDAGSQDKNVEMDECRVCFETGKAMMIECDDCLCGFHLKCLKPPLKEVSEGDWICSFCEAMKLGKEVEMPAPAPPDGKKWRRTFREKLLSSDLWAAHIER